MSSNALIVTSKGPPTVDFDPEAGAAYIRFSNNKVERTIERAADEIIVTVDLDRRGNVVGIEAIGCSEIVIQKIMMKAQVTAPKVDFSRTTFRTVGQSQELAEA